MTSTFIFALSLSLLAALVNFAGLVTIRHFRDWGSENSVLFAAFAAGILIAASFLQLIPQSLILSPTKAPFFIMAGYLLMYTLGLSLSSKGHPSHEERRAIAFIPIVGIAAHSFIDGIVYSSAFTVDIYTGVIAIGGLLLHEFPEGIIAYILLLRGGLSEKRALIFAFLAAAATTPLGFVLSFPFISRLSGDPLGWMLALSAGALIYVSASHLIPHVEHENRKGSATAFALGIATAFIMHLLHDF